MKFGKTFESHLTAEWREQYMRYAELKAMIRNAVETAPHQRRLALDHYQKFSLEFFAILKEELRRVNDFFEYKLAEARRKHATFKVKLMYIVRVAGGHEGDMPTMPPLEGQPTTTRHFARAFSEFYFSLILLNNFQHLNVTAFHKVCKKYDKYIQSTSGHLWLMNHVEPATISQERELHTMIAEVENLYTQFVTKGNRTKAMAKLRVPPLGQPTSPVHVFCTGVVLGLFVVSVLMCIVSYFFLLDKPDLLSTFMRLFRASVSLIFFGFLIVINVHVWQNVGINHLLIFELNPRNQIEPIKLLAIASLFGYICGLSMLIFLHHNEFGISDPTFIPIIGLILPLIYLINPLPICNHHARMWVLRVFGRVFASPFFRVGFIDFFLADQLNSMVLCLVDYYQNIRFYFRYYKDDINSFDFGTDYTIAVLRCVPSWIRFSQCMKRYFDRDPPASYCFNAFTYFSTIISVIISTIHSETCSHYKDALRNPWSLIYFVTAMVSSIACTSWDLIFDFGLFQLWSGEHIFLRDHLVYPKWFYYFAIVADTLIRFSWMLEMVLLYYDLMLPYHCMTMLGLAEIVRRFIWNFLRLENEHLYNCGHFRATRDISISTLNSREDMLVETILEESRDTANLPRNTELHQRDSSF